MCLQGLYKSQIELKTTWEKICNNLKCQFENFRKANKEMMRNLQHSVLVLVEIESVIIRHARLHTTPGENRPPNDTSATNRSRRNVLTCCD